MNIFQLNLCEFFYVNSCGKKSHENGFSCEFQLNTFCLLTSSLSSSQNSSRPQQSTGEISQCRALLLFYIHAHLSIATVDVKTITMKFPETSVPDDTTNICMNFELPSDGEYHVIANEGLIDNPDLTHHVLVFACQEWGKLLLVLHLDC